MFYKLNSHCCVGNFVNLHFFWVRAAYSTQGRPGLPAAFDVSHLSLCPLNYLMAPILGIFSKA